MNDLVVKKVTLLFALFAFSFITVGSWIYGAQISTALFRGVEGFAIFGLFAWLVGKRLMATNFESYEMPEALPDDSVANEENIDKSA